MIVCCKLLTTTYDSFRVQYNEENISSHWKKSTSRKSLTPLLSDDSARIFWLQNCINPQHLKTAK